MNSLDFFVTGNGGSLYWITTRLEIGGISGVYVVDTGGKAIVTTQTIPNSIEDEDSFVEIKYGSGLVVGQKTLTYVKLKNVTLNTKIVHRVSQFPFRDEVDGILGLLPSDITRKRGLKSVEIDFVSQKINFNMASTHKSNLFCVNDFQHNLYPGKLWLRGKLELFANSGALRFDKRDVYFMLDTGATKACTFFDENFKELSTCTKEPLSILKIKNNIIMSLPTNSKWPVCLPIHKKNINFVIIGIQALNSLKSIYFELKDNGEQIGRLCIASY
jgi:hypothetical protein